MFHVVLVPLDGILHERSASGVAVLIKLPDLALARRQRQATDLGETVPQLLAAVVLHVLQAGPVVVAVVLCGITLCWHRFIS